MLRSMSQSNRGHETSTCNKIQILMNIQCFMVIIPQFPKVKQMNSKSVECSMGGECITRQQEGRVSQFFFFRQVLLKFVHIFFNRLLHEFGLIQFIMCVDDYQFRHFSTRRDRLCRKFVIVNEEDLARSYYVNISQFEEQGEVALCKILIHLAKKGLIIDGKKFYLPKFSAIIDPFTFCRISFQALNETEVLLKAFPLQKDNYEIFEECEDLELCIGKEDGEACQNYYCRFEEVDQMEEVYDILNQPQLKQRHSNFSNSEEITSEEKFMDEDKMIDEADQKTNFDKSQKSQKSQRSEEPHRKTKQSERVIGQVIQAVKNWRLLQESKRCNLTNAAKVVGISKKSLDDYFLVVRVGEILGFDYAHNLDKKMGDLRNYIRLSQEKVSGKLGKQVACFSLVPNMDLDQLMKDHPIDDSSLF